MNDLSVCLTFDFDAMSGWIAEDSNCLNEISRGEFGAFALPRVLDLLERHSIRATFFVPGHTALAYPDVARSIHGKGHEIGHHGWVHEELPDVSLDDERHILERGLEALDRTAGVRPVGYRAPNGRFSTNTTELLLEYGFRYDASCYATDFIPYYLRKGDRWSKTEPYEFGETTELVEIPVSFSRDDWPLFEFTPGITAQKSPSQVSEIWTAEFDWAHANVPGGVFELNMHPEVIGRAHRLMMLEELIAHMESKDGVRFETMVEYADRWRKENDREQWLATNPLQARRTEPIASQAGGAE